MAGDWIPMRTNLEDDPTVVFIARATKLQEDHVVGKLHRLWSWVDSHTVDGRVAGIDAAWIDRHVKKRGFAAAMASAPAPWLTIQSDGVTVPHFSHWFGSSAKSRIMNTRRQQMSRIQRDNCHDSSATEARPPNSREEKRLIAPALGGANWNSILTKARSIAEKLGSCGTARNKRLVLGACVIASESSLGMEWLDTAVRETQEAHAQKPYAYLRTVLSRTADEGGVDFKGSVAALVFPAKQPILVLEAPSC